MFASIITFITLSFASVLGFLSMVGPMAYHYLGLRGALVAIVSLLLLGLGPWKLSVRSVLLVPAVVFACVWVCHF